MEENTSQFETAFFEGFEYEVSDLHVVVDFDFREKSDLFWFQTESNVSTAVTTTSLDTFPFLDTGQDDLDQLAEKMLHVLIVQLCLYGNSVTARRNAPRGDTGLGLVGLDTDVGNSLHSHTGNMQKLRPFGSRPFHITVDSDAFHLGDVSKRDGLSQQS